MFNEIHINQFDQISRNKVKSFLTEHHLDFDEDVQFTIAILNDNNEIIATGSMDENVLKCIAVDENYHGLSLTNKIITELMNEQHRRGFDHIFVYTKPENHKFFRDLGFYQIMEINNSVLLLENKKNGISTFLEQLAKHKKTGGKIASIVMNCNPFTKGHRYLIELAAKENDFVHIFIVETDRSYFKTDERLSLVKAGVEDFKNVLVHSGGKYIISPATFPSYFIKDKGKVITAHAQLDLLIFAHYIAPTLNITVRYVGQEPDCLVTNEYNRVMAEILPTYQIEVREVPRLTFENNHISASKVRQLFKNRELDKINGLVPPTTYDWLVEKVMRREVR